ncbi:hypothetical protein NW762_003381 [Fusarium torreyae]|uniref:Uncharacterized protein n=1 Tax=Fusarium torreyae TaxID=1237075 RepID=A0A9W8VJ13_9HYPO|nr:hypothetical protein NW762_003381 [Fusarium torreyae]
MSAYLSFQWPRPDHSNYICWHRTFDHQNANSLIALQVPWIQWPNDPFSDVNSHWRTIRDKARQAVQDWLDVLEVKISGETYYGHMRLTCMILMNEQLRLTVDSLGEGEEHQQLFYGFAADEVAGLEEVKGLKLGKKVVKIVGSGREAYAVAVQRGKKRCKE